MDEKLGFETLLLESPNTLLADIVDENYCPDCYDCDYNCEEHG